MNRNQLIVPIPKAGTTKGNREIIAMLIDGEIDFCKYLRDWHKGGCSEHYMLKIPHGRVKMSDLTIHLYNPDYDPERPT